MHLAVHILRGLCTWCPTVTGGLDKDKVWRVREEVEVLSVFSITIWQPCTLTSFQSGVVSQTGGSLRLRQMWQQAPKYSHAHVDGYRVSSNMGYCSRLSIATTSQCMTYLESQSLQLWHSLPEWLKKLVSSQTGARELGIGILQGRKQAPDNEGHHSVCKRRVCGTWAGISSNSVSNNT